MVANRHIIKLKQKKDGEWYITAWIGICEVQVEEQGRNIQQNTINQKLEHTACSSPYGSKINTLIDGGGNIAKYEST